MANEAVNPIELHGTNKGGVKRYTCADSNAIDKGQLLFLIDPVTVSGAALTDTPAAGIASTEKVASDGQTTIGVWTLGRFDLLCASTAGTGVMAGQLLKISGLNCVTIATANNMISGMVLAKALEQIDGAATETIACELVMV